MRSWKTLAVGLVLTSALVLTSCQQTRAGRERQAFEARPAETLYLAAFEELDRRRWDQAVMLFNEVERQHPYVDWARRSILMSAYSSYMANRYDDAIATAERFINLYPGSSNTAYAYYLIAISHYEQIVDVGRDQGTTLNALNALRQVERRYPNTDYARDARVKIDMTLDHLAGKEMNVGRRYLRDGYTLAAMGRFRRVIDEFETTTHAAEALHRLVESYLTLGLVDEAQKAAAILGYNYPGSDWYSDSYALMSDVRASDGRNTIGAKEEQNQKKFWLWRVIGRIL